MAKVHGFYMRTLRELRQRLQNSPSTEDLNSTLKNLRGHYSVNYNFNNVALDVTLQLLQISQFAFVNGTAFRKILKKHDRTSPQVCDCHLFHLITSPLSFNSFPSQWAIFIRSSSDQTTIVRRHLSMRLCFKFLHCMTQSTLEMCQQRRAFRRAALWESRSSFGLNYRYWVVYASPPNNFQDITAVICMIIPHLPIYHYKGKEAKVRAFFSFFFFFN